MAQLLQLYKPVASSWVMLLVFLILPIIFVSLSRKGNRKLNNNPPNPPILISVACIYQMCFTRVLFHHLLSQLSKIYGPIMQIQLGRVTTLVVSSAEFAKEILKIDDHNFCSRPMTESTRRISYNFMDVIFSPYSEYWREMRKMYVLKLLSMKSVQSFRPVREEEVSIMIKSIVSICHSTSSTEIVLNDLDKRLLSVSMNIFFRILFGTSYHGSVTFGGPTFEEVIYETLELIARFSATDYIPYIGSRIDAITGRRARLEKNFQEWDSFLEKFINDSLESKNRNMENEAIIDVLFEIERGQLFGGSNFSREHIKAVLVNIFLGGLDTTTVTMVWAIAELVKDPRSMKKVQDEVRGCIGKKGKVEESDLDQLQYLKMVVKETLRLHPPGPLLIARESRNRCKIKGYDIFPKTMVLVNVWAIGRNPESWESPNKFFPERFTDTSIDFKGHDFEFLPFGAGRRGCPGISTGSLIMELTLANLLYSFNWELPTGTNRDDLDMEEAGSMALHKKSGLKLVPIIYDE